METDDAFRKKILKLTNKTMYIYHFLTICELKIEVILYKSSFWLKMAKLTHILFLLLVTFSEVLNL